MILILVILNGRKRVFSRLCVKCNFCAFVHVPLFSTANDIYCSNKKKQKTGRPWKKSLAQKITTGGAYPCRVRDTVYRNGHKPVRGSADETMPPVVLASFGPFRPLFLWRAPPLPPVTPNLTFTPARARTADYDTTTAARKGYPGRRLSGFRRCTPTTTIIPAIENARLNRNRIALLKK